MFSWLTSLLVLFLHNNPAQVNATVQQNSSGAGATQTLHTDIDANMQVGSGPSNGGPY